MNKLYVYIWFFSFLTSCANFQTRYEKIEVNSYLVHCTKKKQYCLNKAEKLCDDMKYIILEEQKVQKNKLGITKVKKIGNPDYGEEYQRQKEENLVVPKKNVYTLNIQCIPNNQTKEDYSKSVNEDEEEVIEN